MPPPPLMDDCTRKAVTDMARLSILNLALVPEGLTPADALRNTLDLAQHAERLGYQSVFSDAG